MKRAIRAAAQGIVALAISVLPACNQSEEGGLLGPSRVISIQIAHSIETSDVVLRARSMLLDSSRWLPDGSQISLEPVVVSSFDAMPKISRGEVKPHLWLAANSSLINYVNKNVINLGAPQVDCKTLFATPVVLGTASRQSSELTAGGNTVPLREYLFAPESPHPILLNHSLPNKSDAGLLSFLTEIALIKKTAKDQPLLTGLKRSEERFSRYGNDDGGLLQLAAADRTAAGLRGVLTTEQQVVQQSGKVGGIEPRLVALYPEEGSLWNDYTVCRSQADWVSSPQKRAALAAIEVLQLEEPQLEAQRLGFRPVKFTTESLNAIFDKRVVDTRQPQQHLTALSGEEMAEALAIWPQVRRKSSTIYVVDLSGSMQGEPISGVQRAVRLLIERRESGVPLGLLSFNSEVQLLSKPTTESKDLIAQVAAMEASGGSALYDAVGKAMEVFAGPETTGYFKRIVVFTDGDDKNSRYSFQTFLASLNDKLASQDVTIDFFVLDQEVDYSDLERIAAMTGGFVKRFAVEGSLRDIEEALKE